MNPEAPQTNPLLSHWAIQAIGRSDLELAHQILDQRLAAQAVGQQIAFNFQSHVGADDLLERVLLAYELIAIESLEELIHAAAGQQNARDRVLFAASRAFEIRRLQPVPNQDLDRIFHILQLSTLAYCGDRWSDLRRWYKDHKIELTAPSSADAPWDRRILYRLFHCWVRLFRKDGWDDLDRIRETIAGLRDDQQRMEGPSFEHGTEARNHALAFRLTALYHWAKATEIAALYMLDGQPANSLDLLDKHFDASIQAATRALDPQLEVILRWLHASSHMMVTSSLWWATRTINSRTSDFVRALTHREHHAMFELLPPQRAALLEQGLLDQAKTAIVIDLPTSGGKTLLAQFRILQAINQFDADQGWVAYVAPTRALCAQVMRRLRQDFDPIDVRVEQLTGAVEVDAFEEALLSDTERSFDVLISTPEKLSLVIRNGLVSRPLALVVMDEAHNLADTTRGLRIEFLLATVKQDCPKAAFLLLMPYVDDSESVARWLARDASAGQAISLSTTPWKPNERIIGLYRAEADHSERAGWHLAYETLTTTPKTMPLRGTHRVGEVKPLNVPRSQVVSKDKQKGLGLQTAAMSSVMSSRGTSIAVANNIRTVWTMARKAAEVLPISRSIDDDVRLVQDFLRSEIDPNFELVDMLESGVGVHHAGLSDDVRSLMEWLAESGKLRVLCATSTIAQGLNFPVSSIFLASRFVPLKAQSVEMSSREFWNLAGRAGRIGHDSVGVVGLAEGTDRESTIEFVSKSTGALVSRLVTLLDDLATTGELADLSGVLWQDQWNDFRCYIAHLWAEKKNLDAVLSNSEQLLRNTYGYTTLRNDPATRQKADVLLDATRDYARKLASMPPGIAELADATGFSPEGVRQAIMGMRNLEDRLTTSDWMPESLFADAGKMASLYGVMLNLPQLQDQLQAIGGEGLDHTRISNITRDWVNGKPIGEIAREYFSKEGDEGGTGALTDACRAIYRAIVNNGTWGVAALRQLSGIDVDSLSEAERRRMYALPAMIYHGVRSEEAVLMRMNAVPRTAAELLGSMYREVAGDDVDGLSVTHAREFLKGLTLADWDRARPSDAYLSGSDYHHVWHVLSGES